MKAAKPDVVFYGGYYEQAGRLKKQLTDAGVKATFISGDGALDAGFVKAAGAAGATARCSAARATSPATPAPARSASSPRRTRRSTGSGPRHVLHRGATTRPTSSSTGIKAGNTDREPSCSTTSTG